MDGRAKLVVAESGPSQEAYVRKMVFQAYALCIFTMVFCVNAPAPLFELFRKSNNLNPSELSLLYALYAAIVIAALPSLGRASDRLGRRVLVVLGLGFIAAGSLVLMLGGSFLLLVVGRVLQGLGIAAMSAPAASALAELAGVRRQAAAASAVAVALAVGGASGPLFSGMVADAVTGFPTLPLLVCAAMALAGMVSVALLPDPWQLRQTRKTEPRVKLPALVAANVAVFNDANANGGSLIARGSQQISFWQACAAVVACFGAQATFFTVSGPIFGTLLASHVLLAAGCAMSGLMVASCIGSLLASRLAAKRAITWGMVLLAPGVCGFFGLVGVVPLLALAPAIASIGLGHGLGYAGALHLINETAHGDRRADYTSKFYIAIYLGGGLPVLGMGVLQELIGHTAASGIFSLVIVVIVIGLLVSLRRSAPIAIVAAQ